MANKASYQNEQKILTIALKDITLTSHILNKLADEQILDLNHRNIFKAIRYVNLASCNFEPMTVLNVIENNSEYRSIDGTKIFFELLGGYISSANLEQNIRDQQKFWTISKLNNFNALAKDLDLKNFDEKIWSIEKSFLSIINSHETKEFESIKDAANDYLNKLETIKLHGENLTGTSSGIPAIDKITNGFQPGDLIILAARPSIGKTALALNFLLNAAKTCKEDECVVIFSLEMGTNQLFERLVSCETGIDSFKLKNGNLTNDETYLISVAVSKISKLNIYIDDNANTSIMEIQNKLKQLQKNNSLKIKLVIVDYLQLVLGITKTQINRQLEVAQISRTLKALARELDSPIIAVAQLSRKIEERKGTDKKPILSDLRESGSIEQDADLVTFIDYDKFQLDEENSTDEQKKYKKIVKVDYIIAKHRNGSIAEISLFFDKSIGKYSQLS